MFHYLFSLFHNMFLFLFSLVHHFSLFFHFFQHFSCFFSICFIFFHCFFHYFLLFFNVFQLFNDVVFELLIRLKNTKTDKIEYFRDPGVTWLQIIYLEAFHCVDFFSVCFIVFAVFFHIPGVSDKTNNFAR